MKYRKVEIYRYKEKQKLVQKKDIQSSRQKERKKERKKYRKVDMYRQKQKQKVKLVLV